MRVTSSSEFSAPEPDRPFDAEQWDFVVAACDRLIPADQHGPGAVDLGVPRFIARHLETPYAKGAIWYRQGPYFEAAPEFGYQGPLCIAEILQTGITLTNAYCRAGHDGRSFAELEPQEQISVLSGLEAGTIELGGVPSQVFFQYLLHEVRLGYFSDPVHGGNRDMLGWEMIGYPGAVPDYRDWIGINDRPYPGRPVALADRAKAG